MLVTQKERADRVTGRSKKRLLSLFFQTSLLLSSERRKSRRSFSLSFRFRYARPLFIFFRYSRLHPSRQTLSCAAMQKKREKTGARSLRETRASPSRCRRCCRSTFTFSLSNFSLSGSSFLSTFCLRRHDIHPNPHEALGSHAEKGKTRPPSREREEAGSTSSPSTIAVNSAAMAATEALRQLREEAYCRVVKCFLAGEYSMVRRGR